MTLEEDPRWRKTIKRPIEITGKITAKTPGGARISSIIREDDEDDCKVQSCTTPFVCMSVVPGLVMYIASTV